MTMISGVISWKRRRSCRGMLHDDGDEHSSAWNYVMAVILKVWRQIENPTQSIDAYLQKEHPCQISFRSDLNGHLSFLEEVAL